MGGASLPPGFRFHPTDEELIGYYLNRRVNGMEIELEVIPIVELYKFDPWELPEKSFLPKRDMEWFFFCPRDRKYPNGNRTNRATNAGYWKATGKDRKIVCPTENQSAITGYRKTLVFYRGRAPLGDRTDWVMHEYRLCDDVTSQNRQGSYALCRVIKKNEPHSYMEKKTRASSSNASPLPAREEESIRTGKNIWVSPELILDSSQGCPQPFHAPPGPSYLPQYEYQGSVFPWDANFGEAGIGGEGVASPYDNYTGFGGGGSSLFFGNNF